MPIPKGTALKYSVMYRLGLTPWEGYARVARASIGAQLDRAAGRTPQGRALDVGCGRGVTALASPGASLLLLAFGPTRMRWRTPESPDLSAHLSEGPGGDRVGRPPRRIGAGRDDAVADASA